MTHEEAIKVLRNKRKLGVTLEEAHAYMLAIEAMEQWVYDWDSKEWISPSDRFEVIGNIHDNLELLGGDKE